ncbi:tetratricopeptide repeat protein, partial [Pectobacterium polaris]
MTTLSIPSLLLWATLGCAFYTTPAFSSKFDDKTFSEVQALANQNDAEAQNALGDRYYDGEDVKQDYQQAVIWYQKAATQNNPDAQYSLGYMFDKGKSVQQDYTQAVIWYTKAAEQGDAWAQTNLAYLYETGKGVPQDYAQA